MTAFDLITTNDPIEAGKIAYELDTANGDRQKVERAIFDEAIEMIGPEENEMGIVLAKEGWHPGVIGIVASRLANKFTKPTILIAIDGELGRGSSRGVRNFDILQGLSNCSSLLEKFGGHKAAAGLTIKAENIEEFKEAFLCHLRESLTAEDLIPEVDLDALISLDEIDYKLVSEIESLSPFGIANREPLLCAVDAHIVFTEVVGSRHLRFKVRHKGDPLRGIGFGLAGLHPLKGPGFDLAFRPYFDDWNGTRNLSIKVKDVKKPSV
jgi:single-stranded-DNA-specific exonuclease